MCYSLDTSCRKYDSQGKYSWSSFAAFSAGPATNAATITMVTRFLGKRSAALYVGMISSVPLEQEFYWTGSI